MVWASGDKFLDWSMSCEHDAGCTWKRQGSKAKTAQLTTEVLHKTSLGVYIIPTFQRARVSWECIACGVTTLFGPVQSLPNRRQSGVHCRMRILLKTPMNSESVTLKSGASDIRSREAEKQSNMPCYTRVEMANALSIFTLVPKGWKKSTFWGTCSTLTSMKLMRRKHRAVPLRFVSHLSCEVVRCKWDDREKCKEIVLIMWKTATLYKLNFWDHRRKFSRFTCQNYVNYRSIL